MKDIQSSFAKKVSIFYDKLAKSRKKWIKKGSSFHREDRLNLKELILPESRILELGCGTGYLLKSSLIVIKVMGFVFTLNSNQEILTYL